MLNKSIRFLIQNPPISLTVAVMVIVFGVVVSPFNIGFDFLPKDSVAVDAIPNLSENQQIVYTAWEGQSPQDIENQVTYPLSSNLLGIPGLKSIRSSSMYGYSNIYLIFEDGLDFYWCRSRILEKLNSLPTGLMPGGVTPQLGPDATALGQVFWYTLEGRDSTGKVTGGWNLQELRSIQDFYVKNALYSGNGVAEVASIGGFVKEYQIDVKPEMMKQYGISLGQIVDAVKRSNKDVGAKTIEINRVEYFVRGLGYVNSISDIEETTILANDFAPIRIKDIARVTFGPAERRGILDKGGAEVVGGVVTSRHGTNPMVVLDGIKEKVKEIQVGLPSKTLEDGRISKLTIIPFYDRSELINDSLNTLGQALTLEILIAILVVVLMLSNLRASFLISGLLPLSVLVIFIAMKYFEVDANIVALSGIAIAIGTVVDMGIILTENIIQHIKDNPKLPIKEVTLKATKEVSGAILTAGLTTIISFAPIFSLTGAEGKLFIPLAFTKTIALVAALTITLFVLPVVAAFVFDSKKPTQNWKLFAQGIWLIGGVVFFLFGTYLALILIAYGLLGIWLNHRKTDLITQRKVKFVYTISALVFLLAWFWKPLGLGYSLPSNLAFTIVAILLILLPIYFFMSKYELILRWVLDHKAVGIAIPIIAVLLGFLIMSTAGKEFMPSLDEGEFLIMPTSMPHSGIEENHQVLKKLDMAVSSIPEVEYVVGKAGRVESPLDPAPLSMFENIIAYKPEYILDNHKRPLSFKVDEDGNYLTRSGTKVKEGSQVALSELIPDKKGKYFRNWRPDIATEDDIWNEIVDKTQIPGITASPKLHPIATRLVMLQTGMRSPFGIKVKGQDLKSIERFGLELEMVLRDLEGIRSNSIFADRIIGKPYLLVDVDRDKISRYGLSVEDVQQTLEVAVGGKTISQTIEGRERYPIRIRYPRELRSTPEDLGGLYVNTFSGMSIPLMDLVNITYEKGPQIIKSEDGFLVGYVTFDKHSLESEVNIIEKAKKRISEKIESGELTIPSGVSYTFSGTYENHLHAQRTLTLVIPLALIVIFLILYFQFGEFKISLMIFSGVAVAFAGGFILIWLYNQSWFLNFEFMNLNLRDFLNVRTINLSVAVWVGFIALFGIATDDGVVMATYLKQSYEKQKPKDAVTLKESIITAGKRRLRPCLMTTATTLLALLPILTSTGRGSDIMIPLAIPCFGGMSMAMITLFVVPVLYCWEKEINLLKKNQAP